MFPTLVAMESGDLLPSVALDILISIIRENLEECGAPANIQNAGQIANLVSASLLPGRFLSRFTANGVERGVLPEFSTVQSEPHALERGVAVLMSNIVLDREAYIPRDAASQLWKLLKSRGHLPKPEDIWE